MARDLLAAAVLSVLLYFYTLMWMELSYREGYRKAVQDRPNLNQQIQANQETLSEVCYRWWFVMTHKERRLK